MTATKNDADQRELAAAGCCCRLHGGLGHPYEGQQENKRQMKADFNSEQSPDRDGPVAHQLSRRSLH